MTFGLKLLTFTGFSTQKVTGPQGLYLKKTEYMLNHNVFLQICEHFGLHLKVDLFVSRLNAQVKDFYSFGPDPYCKLVDAFTIPWDKDCCYYMFAPFNLINRALAKIGRDRTKVVLAILPKWPNQPWYSMMSTMLLPSTPPPLFFKPTKNLLTLSWSSDTAHPNLKNLHLHSIVLSGINTQQHKFHNLQ